LDVPVGAPAMTAEALYAKTAVQAFRGGIVHSLALGQLQVLEDGLLTVGRVKKPEVQPVVQGILLLHPSRPRLHRESLSGVPCAAPSHRTH
jgi:hypothetical protein